MLDLRPNCECCGKDLPPSALDALICSFECTFCQHCSVTKLHGYCPNCSGDLKRRPTRSDEMLKKFPASIKRIVKPDACEQAESGD
ncbi:hypothetical protein CAL12_20500 [Bordetella genomosp. 8]|uniref:DUF1272 domain-containing protein n=1 Tax=Bordetella genomosp. 8 TaxID=1416806 RepID=A0A1W6YPM3_9BORD|nr:DUF1272 domain-containing protein [Bordetella genomosp. 8]ARP82961.1 hypothetical protein CAL12_20500 [Bordetella genomosp. 8]